MELFFKKIENLSVHIFETREELGAAAAADAAMRINTIIRSNNVANVMFAAAPSQNELLEYLLRFDIDWKKVRAFHQDEYIGIDENEPAGFGNFLRRSIFSRVDFKEIHYLLCNVSEEEKKCEDYSALLRQYPIDVIFLGIGENGHLAFNDPSVADFNDSEVIKIVQLDDVCRQQQVNDGCFAAISDVPKQAMSLSMSYIMSIPQAICCVPTERKAEAVKNALFGPISTRCPASILRQHKNASLYLDKSSAKYVL